MARSLPLLGLCVVSAYADVAGAGSGDVHLSGGFKLAGFGSNLVAGVNATLGSVAAKQIEYELHFTLARNLNGGNPSAKFPRRSKVALAVVHALGFGCCGVDRCCMGQTCLGVVKGLTLGGLAVWAIIDWVVMLINMLQKAKFIDTWNGFQAEWDPAEIDTAFWICLVGLVWQCCVSGGGACAKGAQGQTPGTTPAHQAPLSSAPPE